MNKQPQVGEYWEFKYRNTRQVVRIDEIMFGIDQYKVTVLESTNGVRNAPFFSSNYWLPEHMRRYLGKGYGSPLWKVLNEV